MASLRENGHSEGRIYSDEDESDSGSDSEVVEEDLYDEVCEDEREDAVDEHADEFGLLSGGLTVALVAIIAFLVFYFLHIESIFSKDHPYFMS